MVSLFIRLGIILAAVTGLILLLPASAGLPADVESSLALIVSYGKQFDSVFPVNTALTILGLAIAFHLGVFLFKGFNWLLHKITTGSAGS